jgi:hypothetical protein
LGRTQPEAQQDCDVWGDVTRFGAQKAYDRQPARRQRPVGSSADRILDWLVAREQGLYRSFCADQLALAPAAQQVVRQDHLRLRSNSTAGATAVSWSDIRRS